jgi:tetratricopeptide (TPR) repeat protein
MKKYFGIILALCCVAQIVPAQNEYGYEAEPYDYGFTEEFAAEGTYYIVRSDKDSDGAEALVKELELRMAAYNRLFHFDPDTMQGPLMVRAFTDQEAYDAYISERLGNTQEGAVYLHYSSGDRRELIIHRGSPDEEAMVSHQAFIQFLRSFITNPPAWIREGFAVFFSTLSMNHTDGQLQDRENLDWLETVKTLGNQAPAPYQILMADIDGAPDNFQASAWALSSFFLKGGGTSSEASHGDYFRILGEMFMALSPEASAMENTSAAMRRLSLSADMETVEKDYRAYLTSRQTFPELIASGRTAYEGKDLTAAERYFSEAAEARPSHFAPHYYLGLLAYEKKEYEAAESYYQKALEYGADAPLVNYALGLNAASAGRGADAVAYLEQAAAAAPDRYGEKAKELISRLNGAPAPAKAPGAKAPAPQSGARRQGR